MIQQLHLFDSTEASVDTDVLLPDEVVTSPHGYTISIYYPSDDHYKAWLKSVDETLLDMTGYSVHDFSVVPSSGDWQQWPTDAYAAARLVLQNDMWGQAFLHELEEGGAQ